MAYTLDISLALGSSQTGLTLEAMLVNTAGADVGSAVTTGFVEIGGGNYLFHYAAWPDNHRGGVKFRVSPGGALKAFTAINPEEAEHADAKTGSRLASASYTAPDNAGIDAIEAAMPARGSDGRVLVSANAHTSGETVAAVTGAVGSVTGAVGSVTGNVVGNVSGSVGSLAAQAKADVNAEVVDALVTDTHAEPTVVPAASASLKDKIGWLFTLARNRFTQTASQATLRNDADAANVGTAAVNDDGTTFTRNRWT